MIHSKRFISLLILGISLFVIIRTEESSADCMDKVSAEVGSGDTITIFTTDGKTFLASAPMMKLSDSAFYVTSVSDTGQSYYVFQMGTIDHFCYRKQSWFGKHLILVGLAVGATAGAVIGVAAAPEPTGSWNLTELRTGIVGGALGGLIGAVLGHSVGKKLKVTVTVACDSP